MLRFQCCRNLRFCATFQSNIFIDCRRFALIFGRGWAPRDPHGAKSEYLEHACGPGAHFHRFFVTLGIISGGRFQTFWRFVREWFRSVFKDARKTCFIDLGIILDVVLESFS